MAREVGLLRRALLRRDERDVSGRPHLAVRVGVAAAHHRALVLEHLDVADGRIAPERFELRRPRVDDGADLRRPHLGEREVVTRGEAEHAAAARRRLGHEEAARRRRAARRPAAAARGSRCRRRTSSRRRGSSARSPARCRGTGSRRGRSAAASPAARPRPAPARAAAAGAASRAPIRPAAGCSAGEAPFGARSCHGSGAGGVQRPVRSARVVGLKRAFHREDCRRVAGEPRGASASDRRHARRWCNLSSCRASQRRTRRTGHGGDRECRSTSTAVRAAAAASRCCAGWARAARGWPAHGAGRTRWRRSSRPSRARARGAAASGRRRLLPLRPVHLSLSRGRP